MPQITPIDALAIAKLIIFSPLFLASIFLLIKHGFTRAAGWLQLSIVCLIRVMGSAAQIATITNPNDITAYIMADVLLVIGIAPLLGTMVGLVSRATMIHLPTATAQRNFKYIVSAINLIGLAGLIICIKGSTDITSLDQLTSQPLLTAGKVLFAVSLASITALAIMSAFLHRRVRREGKPYEAGENAGGEGILLVAVFVAVPLIAVRLVYAFLSSFGKDRARFSPFTGSIGLQVALSVWEEIVVVVMFVVVGFMVPKVVAPKKSAEDVVELGGAGSDSHPQEKRTQWFDKQWVRYVPLIRLIAKAQRKNAREEARKVAGRSQRVGA